MMQLSIKKIAEVIGVVVPEADITAGGVCIDSRQVKAGDCFFAIKGDNFDGHNFIDQAFASGAVCAVVSNNRRADNIINVADTIQALGLLANYYRLKAGYRVIAITGSAGKTTTKNMIYHVLSQHFLCHRSPKSFNNNIGLPLTLLGAEADCKIVIAEIGSNHPGEISPLSIMATPDIAMITNIYPTHLEGFGSIEAIIEEKVAITDGLRKTGIFFINADFVQLKAYCKEKKLDFKTFANICEPDFDAASSSFNIDGIKVILHSPGKANVENAVAAWSVCSEFGITAELFAEAIRSFKPAEMRLDIMEIGPVTVLNDCYNANPASMINALEVLRGLASEKKFRAVFICGTMGELGQHSREYHARLGEQIAEIGIELLLTAGTMSGEAAKAASKRAGNRLKSEIFKNTKQLCDNLAKFIEPDDIILVKASRSERFETVVNKLKEIFQYR